MEIYRYSITVGQDRDKFETIAEYRKNALSSDLDTIKISTTENGKEIHAVAVSFEELDAIYLAAKKVRESA